MAFRGLRRYEVSESEISEEYDPDEYPSSRSATRKEYSDLYNFSGRQDEAFDICCKNCFKSGARIKGEPRFQIIDTVMSSDELVKPSSVVLERSREAWRTASESAWLHLKFGGLCEVWGIVISWWCNSFADQVKLVAAVDEEGEYWNQITGTDTHLFPEFDRVTRIDFNRTPTTQIRIDITGGHPDFLSKRFLLGIRRVEAIGCRGTVQTYYDDDEPAWQPPERVVVEKGLRKIDRENMAGAGVGEVQKKLYMPGEALQEAQAMCQEGKVPPWSLVVESGIMGRYQVWPGTKERSRMQVPSKYRWTVHDPSHPAYWMSPRERVKRQCMSSGWLDLMQEQSKVVNDEDEEDGVWEECRHWENDSRMMSPTSTRPSSALPSTRPTSGMRGQMREKRPVSGASTRPTTAGTSRAGSRPSTPSLYGSRGSVRASGRPSSSGVYAHRFGGQPSTAGNARPSTAGNARPSSAGSARPSSAGSVRPGSAPLRGRGTIREG